MKGKILIDHDYDSQGDPFIQIILPDVNDQDLDMKDKALHNFINQGIKHGFKVSYPDEDGNQNHRPQIRLAKDQ